MPARYQWSLLALLVVVVWAGAYRTDLSNTAFAALAAGGVVMYVAAAAVWFTRHRTDRGLPLLSTARFAVKEAVDASATAMLVFAICNYRLAPVQRVGLGVGAVVATVLSVVIASPSGGRFRSLLGRCGVVRPTAGGHGTDA